MVRPMEKEIKLDGLGVEHTTIRRETRTKFWSGNFNRKHHLEEISLDWTEIL
jgi:hypothetical protein